MTYQEIRDVVFEILQEANGYFLLPYQIFEKIKIKDNGLASRIEADYPVQAGNPPMGAGAGIYYSPASFVAHALDYFKNSNTEIRKEWLEPTNISIREILPGNPEAISIWAWREDV